LAPDLYSDRKIPSVDDRIRRTTEIEKTTMEIEEKGVKLRLTIVDTPGETRLKKMRRLS
jgi:septin family protein